MLTYSLNVEWFIRWLSVTIAVVYIILCFLGKPKRPLYISRDGDLTATDLVEIMVDAARPFAEEEFLKI